MSTVAFLSRTVAAGFPSPAADYLEQPLDLQSYLITNPPATVLARVKGDSMIEAGIYDHDIVVIDRSLTPVHGQVVVAALDGGLVVKYWHVQPAGILLRSANQHYADLLITPDNDLVVWGVVTAVVRKLI